MAERIGKSREAEGKPHITRSRGQWTVVVKGWRWHTKDFDRACAIAGWCRRSMYSLPQSDRRSSIVPKSKAAAKTDLQATGLNPFGSQAVAGGQNITVLLTTETGRNPDTPGLLDAIETFYGAGKVTCENDTCARGILRLRVAA